MSFNKYVLIDGIACVLLGSVRATEDVILRGDTPLRESSHFHV